MTARRWRNIGAAMLGIAIIVSGCTTGSAPEAERAKQLDTQRSSVIDDMQATHTWELVNGTPTPDDDEN